MNARMILIGLGLVLAGTAWGQVDTSWTRTFGSRYNDRSASMIRTSDGGFAMAGSKIHSQSDFCLVRTNQDGDSLWSRSYGSQDEESCTSLIQVADGGFIMVGLTKSRNDSPNDVLLIKTNSEGDSLWARTFEIRSQNRHFAIIEISDGGFAIAGGESWQPYGYGNGLLIVTNSEGDSLWARRYGGYRGDCFYSLIQTTDGGFVLAGLNNSHRVNSTEFWLVRTDEEGDSLWSKTYSGGSVSHCRAILETPDGGFALAGFNFGVDNQSYDYWLVRTSADGDSLWSRSFGGRRNEMCNSLVQTPDGGFVLAGSLTNASSDLWLVRTDFSGDSVWSCRIGGDRDEECASLIQISDESFVIAGSTNSFGAGNTDFYLVKTSPDPVSVRDPRSTLKPLTFNLFPAFPNPFNSMVTIPFGLDKSAPSRLAIFDPLGRRVADLFGSTAVSGGRFHPAAEGGATTRSVVWNAAGMPTGQYIIRLDAGNQQLSQRLSLVK